MFAFSSDFPEMTSSVYGRNLMTITLEQAVPVTHQISTTLFWQRCTVFKNAYEDKKDGGGGGLWPDDTIARASKKNASFPLHICGWIKTLSVGKEATFNLNIFQNSFCLWRTSGCPKIPSGSPQQVNLNEPFRYPGSGWTRTNDLLHSSTRPLKQTPLRVGQLA